MGETKLEAFEFLNVSLDFFKRVVRFVPKCLLNWTKEFNLGN